MFFAFFTEAFLSAQLVPLASSASFFALRGFGGASLYAPALVAALGAAAGQGVNYLLGRVLLALRNREHLYLNETLYRRARRVFLWLLPLLCLSWVPLGSIAVLVAGFLAMGWRRSILLIFLGQLGYYLYWAFVPG